MIKVWKAQEIVESAGREGATDARLKRHAETQQAMGVGYGKVVLLGEHAVVYGRHAIAAPIPMAIKALVEDCDRAFIC